MRRPFYHSRFLLVLMHALGRYAWHGLHELIVWIRDTARFVDRPFWDKGAGTKTNVKILCFRVWVKLQKKYKIIRPVSGPTLAFVISWLSGPANNNDHAKRGPRPDKHTQPHICFFTVAERAMTCELHVGPTRLSHYLYERCLVADFLVYGNVAEILAKITMCLYMY